VAKKNLFIVGMDPFNREILNRMPQAEGINFHTALDRDEVREADELDSNRLVTLAAERIQNYPGPVHGVACFFDFPFTTLVPILAERFGLPGPSLESVLKCEHKYWSRLEQQKVAREHIPQFRYVDPRDHNAWVKLDLLSPFWLKPVKSFRSYLSYRINGERQFQQAREEIAENIGYFGDPFKAFMASHTMPSELVDLADGCIAESTLNGLQCTLEGYVYNGQVIGYGIVDSVRELDRSSFSRYEYPSSLPMEICHRIIDIARTVIPQIGLDNCPFNIEFFYEQTSDQVYLLEINPRLSQSHALLFEMVKGMSHHAVMAQLALGYKPPPFEKRGQHNVAGHFMVRTYEDGVVTRIPEDEELEEIGRRYPGTTVKLLVEPGVRLSEMRAQDSYSFELANVYIGGRDQNDMLEKYDAILSELRFEIEKDAELTVM